MGKTLFSDGNPATGTLGTIVTAEFLNKLNNQRHTGRDIDGEGALDYAVATGSANAYEVVLTPALDAYIEGMPIIFKANHDNTGAATLNVNSLGAISLKKGVNQDLAAGDIKTGQIVVGIYGGTTIQIISATSTATSVGSEMWWPTETPPEGWFEENGASLDRTTYPALFAAIGTMYGAEDSTHFNLPDARGKFLRAWAHGQATDPDRESRTAPTVTGATLSAGDHVGTEQADEFKEHTHSCLAQLSPATTGSNYWVTNPGGETGATGGNETRPINTYRMLIIKAY